MYRLIGLSLIQSTFLVAAQVFLKFAMQRMGKFSFTIDFFKQLLVNWQLLFSGISIVIATLLWMYILKHFDFSMAYPLISMSYVIGAIAAVVIFNETIPINRWIGLGLIILGVIFVVQK